MLRLHCQMQESLAGSGCPRFEMWLVHSRVAFQLIFYQHSMSSSWWSENLTKLFRTTQVGDSTFPPTDFIKSNQRPRIPKEHLARELKSVLRVKRRWYFGLSVKRM